jgi:1-deoxy-D-xylulose-5-phosphate synthase
VAVLNARCAKPLDVERIAALARRCAALVTVEEHAVLGGFGAAVLEALAAEGLSVAVRCLGVPDQLVEHGDPGEVLAALGLDAAGIARAVREAVAAARAAGR